MAKRKCKRCQTRWSQCDGVCRSCENEIIAHQALKARLGGKKDIAPQVAKAGGFGVNTYLPGLVGLSFFGIVHSRR